MLQRLDLLLACLGLPATEALSTLARALTGKVRAGGSLARFSAYESKKVRRGCRAFFTPSLHTIIVARALRHFRAIDSGTWVPGKVGPVVNDCRNRQGLTGLRSSGREHTSLLAISTVQNLVLQGGTLDSGQLRTRYAMRDVPTMDLSWISNNVYHSDPGPSYATLPLSLALSFPSVHSIDHSSPSLPLPLTHTPAPW